MKTALVVIVVIVLMAVSGIAGFYFGNDNGFKTAQSIRAEFFAQRAGGAGAGGQFANGTPQAQGQGQRGGGTGGQGGQGTAFGRPTAAGIVKAVQGNTITVTQQDGTATTVSVDDKTQYEKLVNGTLADVQAGLRIVVTDVNGIKRIQLTPVASQ